MGLDMYAFKVTKPEEPSPIHLIIEADYEPFDQNNVEQIFYWRKHPNLHGWMEKLYYKKGGKADSFNCVNLVLNKEDIENLEKDVLENKLPQTSGFFFGEPFSIAIEQDKTEDLKFIKLAKKELEAGNVVYYSSWW